MEHDDDSDDSSEDSEDDVEASPEDMEAIMSLESSMQASPQSYELHAQVIAFARPPRPPRLSGPARSRSWSAVKTMLSWRTMRWPQTSLPAAVCGGAEKVRAEGASEDGTPSDAAAVSTQRAPVAGLAERRAESRFEAQGSRRHPGAVRARCAGLPVRAHLDKIFGVRPAACSRFAAESVDHSVTTNLSVRLSVAHAAVLAADFYAITTLKCVL